MRYQLRVCECDTSIITSLKKFRHPVVSPSRVALVRTAKMDASPSGVHTDRFATVSLHCLHKHALSSTHTPLVSLAPHDYGGSPTLKVCESTLCSGTLW